MKGFPRPRLLPVLVAVAALCLMVRTGEFAAGVRQAGIAFAQQEAESASPPPPVPQKSSEEQEKSEKQEKEEKSDGENKGQGGENGAAHEGDAVNDAADVPASDSVAATPPAEKVDWKDSSEAAFEYSSVREELYKELVARREEIEKREKKLVTREALLEATERELDQKIREMTAVRNEIESLMKSQSDEEKERIGSLVRIYEGMKAKDAARIFNTLDMDVLIAVMARMSERKSAPILAEMTPERARSVTILLAQQKQLPEIPPQ